MSTRKLLSLLAPAALLAACGDPSAVPPQDGLAPGTYQLSVSGDRTLSRAGQRAIVGDANGRVAIVMGTHPESAGADTTVVFYLQVPPGLTLGAHPIAEFGPESRTMAVLSFANSQGYTHSYRSVANGGTLTLTRKTGTGVEGEFSFDAEGAEIRSGFAPRESLRITGRFHASY